MIQTLEGTLCVGGKSAHMRCFVPRIRQRMKLDAKGDFHQVGEAGCSVLYQGLISFGDQ